MKFIFFFIFNVYFIVGDDIIFELVVWYWVDVEIIDLFERKLWN